MSDMRPQRDRPSKGHDREQRLAYARERALRSEFERVADEIADLRNENQELRHELLKVRRKLISSQEQFADHRTEYKTTVRELDERIDRRRLDRQLAALPTVGARRIIERLRPRRTRVTVICPSYPGGPRAYGGQFVRARVRLYVEAGLEVTVLVVRDHIRETTWYEHEGVPVARTSPSRLQDLLAERAPDSIAVHHLQAGVWEVLRHMLDDVSVAVFVHGYEARDWRELEYNYSPEFIARWEAKLESDSALRRSTMAAVFVDQRVTVVFVSDFMRSVAEQFVGRPAANSVVIPNVIDDRRFPYVPKSPELRRRVLWVRSFDARSYANDVARDVVLELAKRPVGESIAVTVVGDGKHFEEVTGPLEGLDGVDVQRGFVTTDELRRLHLAHGIMLAPTRWDSQGLTSCEAMSSGLVPITNRVTAVPEFIPDDAGMVCPPEDHVAMADAIERLVHEPELFTEMSARAAASIQQQCGRSATTDREIGLLRASLWKRLTDRS